MTVTGAISGAFDVVVIGGGAAGLFCAAAAGARGRSVLVAEHANKVGKKILMSGGGRCNFTNLHCGPDNFLSANPHFCKSALSRYTPWDFVELVERHRIEYYEKTLGQLFCTDSSKRIVAMLLAECETSGVVVHTRCPVRVEQLGPPHRLSGDAGDIVCETLVIATGGYSIPRMGATGFGFDFARSLGLTVQETRAALVPVTLPERKLAQTSDLSGIALDSITAAGGAQFRENLLFTHRGLSGPAVLQASSYWQPGEPMVIDLFPDIDLAAHIRRQRTTRPRVRLHTLLAETLARRVAQRWCELWLPDKPLAELSDAEIEAIASRCKAWAVWPDGTEGYRTAEVTLGGIDTVHLSSKTMACREHEGLFFIGEVVDVTGHLGGHNFQWAWASARAAGEAV